MAAEDKSIGFDCEYHNEVIYSPPQIIFVVGKLCYRGGPGRFDIPREFFEFTLDDTIHQIRGGSDWRNFYTGSRWNPILVWLDSAYSVVAVEEDVCVDITIDTRYRTGETFQSLQKQGSRLLSQTKMAKRSANSFY